MKVDYIIVGQGLAGSFLAWELIHLGQRVMVVDREDPVTSSKVAGGICNPLAGKALRLSNTTKAALPIAQKFYWDAEEAMNQKLFHHTRMLRVFQNATQHTAWNERATDPEYSNFWESADCIPSDLLAPHGLVEVKQSGWLDTSLFLASFQNWLMERISYAVCPVDASTVDFSNHSVKWRNIDARGVVFCEGWALKENPLLQPVQADPAKGEILTIDCPALAQETRILHSGVWMIPLGGGKFRVGSNYDHDFEDLSPTESAKIQIIDRLKNLIRADFEIIDHQAAARPVIRRGIPSLGAIPNKPGGFVFNGLGSKGSLVGPYYAKMLADYLIDHKPLAKEIDVAQQFDFG
ncbi:MAG: FAD-binding oxidoreductase [Verrucomicrobiota bacterium]